MDLNKDISEISERFGDYRYDFTHETLYCLSEKGQEAVPLEKVCTKALHYFLKNPDRVVTYEELLQNVWSISGVSFSRVHRVISIIRGALRDDPIKPVYIQTIKKVGFKFTGFQLNHEAKNHAALAKTKLYKKFSLAIGLTTLALAWYGSEQFIGLQVKETVNFNPKPLLGQIRIERDFTVNSDSSVIAFLSEDEDYTELAGVNESKILLTLIKSERKEYLKIALPNELHNVTTLSWHPTENKIAYRTMHKSKYCKLWVATLDDDLTKIVDNELVGECSKDYFFVGFIHWTNSGDGLFYSDLANSTASMSVYHLNLHTRIVSQLTSPPTSSVGDYHISPSPDGKSILFLRDDSRTLSQLWTLELDTLEQKMVHSFRDGFYPRFVEWDESSKGFVYKEADNSLYRIDADTLKVSLFSKLDLNVVSMQRARNGRYFAAVSDGSVSSTIKISNPFVEEPKEAFEYKPSRRYAFNPVEDLPDVFFDSKGGSLEQWLEYKDGRKTIIRTYPMNHFNSSHRFTFDGKKILTSIGPEVWAGDFDEQPALLNKTGQILMRPSWGACNKSVYAIEAKNNWSVVAINTETLEQSIYATAVWFFEQSPDGNFEVVVKTNTDAVVLRDVKKNTFEELLVPDYTRNKDINVFFEKEYVYIKCHACTLPGHEKSMVLFRYNLITKEHEYLPLHFGRGDKLLSVVSDGKELLLDYEVDPGMYSILEMKQE